MSIIGSHILAGAAGSGVSAYEIEQSLRFNSADSAYLNRTPGSAGNRKTWTLSCWLKLSSLTQGERNILFGPAGGTFGGATVYQDGGLRFAHAWDPAGTDYVRETVALFRDPSAWYHVVWWCDTTQSGTRWKIYVNGVEQTLQTPSGLNGEPAQNTDLPINSTDTHYLGGNSTYGYFSGYLAEVNFIDGSALDHEDFGELDDNGVWRPKRYTGSYTGNSFYLKFASGDGTDSSGLSNTWTANNFTTSGTGTDVMSDTPTTNWCTLNPLRRQTDNCSLSNGNLTASHGNGTYPGATATFPVSSGKWYYEFKITTKTSNPMCGLCRADYTSGGTGRILYRSDGRYIHYDGSEPTGPNSFTTGDVIGVAIDLDDANGKIRFYKNGTVQTSTTGLDNVKSHLALSTYGYINIYIQMYSGDVCDLNFGQRDFEYTPPTGYKALNTANLPAPTIKDGSDYFNTVLWTGNGVSGRAVTGVGFQPDFLWIKRRNAAVSHYLQNSVTGATNYMFSDDTVQERNLDDSVDSFDTDGFTLGNDSGTNGSGGTYVGWNWKANGSGSSNTDGSITSTVSANPSAGFSIVTYSGAGSNATVGHGLGVAPRMIIIKTRNGSNDWAVYHADLGASKIMYLNLNYDQGGSGVVFGSTQTEPTSTVFTVGNHTYSGQSGSTYVAYCFAEVEGYSKFGSYTGNGSTDGTFVYCGFKPAWIMVKTSSNAYGWAIHDTTRQTYNEDERILEPNTSGAEATNSLWGVDILSNGFKWRNNGEVFNFSGYTYIFAAFSEHPFGGSGVSPATAR